MKTTRHTVLAWCHWLQVFLLTGMLIIPNRLPAQSETVPAATADATADAAAKSKIDWKKVFEKTEEIYTDLKNAKERVEKSLKGEKPEAGTWFGKQAEEKLSAMADNISQIAVPALIDLRTRLSWEDFGSEDPVVRDRPIKALEKVVLDLQESVKNGKANIEQLDEIIKTGEQLAPEMRKFSDILFAFLSLSKIEVIDDFFAMCMDSMYIPGHIGNVVTRSKQKRESIDAAIKKIESALPNLEGNLSTVKRIFAHIDQEEKWLKEEKVRLEAMIEARNKMVADYNRVVADFNRRQNELPVWLARLKATFKGCPNNHDFDRCNHGQIKAAWMADWMKESDRLKGNAEQLKGTAGQIQDNEKELVRRIEELKKKAAAYPEELEKLMKELNQSLGMILNPSK